MKMENEMERGTLVRWNPDKGFGFIKPLTGKSQDIFIHISTLKQMARKPMVGDEILFSREIQNNGKVRAIKASIEGVPVVASSVYPSIKHRESTKHTNQASHSRNHKSNSVIVRLTSTIIIVCVFSFGFTQYQKMSAAPVIHDKKTTSPIFLDTPTHSFRCETGKVYCSQMRSCEEAMYYIQNCPGTKMDGNGDGIPYERQHCG